MFPLGSVLLPHMPLGLRLFEPRYLRMLGELLEGPEPQFGVVLIERGHEVGGGDQRFGMGTLARVIEVEARQEFMAVIARGTTRFEVEQWLPDQPYPRAEIREVDDFAWEPSLAAKCDEVEAQVRAALTLAGGSGDVELAEDPIARAWQVAGLTPVGPLDQLRLLSSADLAELLDTTARVTHEALETLRYMQA